jgi:hypothetical protein
MTELSDAWTINVQCSTATMLTSKVMMMAVVTRQEQMKILMKFSSVTYR